MLEVEGIHTFYGLSHILFGVSLNVDAGQIVCLLGRNGAGKTTTLKSIMGLNPPSMGRIRFNNEDITGIAPYRLARKGMGYVPDDRRIFADLSVNENLTVPKLATINELQVQKINTRELEVECPVDKLMVKHLIAENNLTLRGDALLQKVEATEIKVVNNFQVEKQNTTSS